MPFFEVEEKDGGRVTVHIEEIEDVRDKKSYSLITTKSGRTIYAKMPYKDVLERISRKEAHFV